MKSQLWIVAGTWIAFVFGAAFNVLSASTDEPLIEFTIKTIIGGLVWLGIQLLTDHFKNRRNAKKKPGKRPDEHENGDNSLQA